MSSLEREPRRQRSSFEPEPLTGERKADVIELFNKEGHRNICFHELGGGMMVQANQHIIVDGGEAALLDPGGHKVFPELLSELYSLVPLNGLKHIVLSHQDPDIVAAVNGWLMSTTDTVAYIPSLWLRFITHFGVDSFVMNRLLPVEDEGTTLEVNGRAIKLIPAHFLHSPANFQVYDTVSKILYTGDLGASVGCDYQLVEDFDQHLTHMQGFHERLMPSSKAMKAWVRTVSQLEIDIIAPQHGAMFANKELVERFIAWVDGLKCGVDLIGESWEIPG